MSRKKTEAQAQADTNNSQSLPVQPKRWLRAIYHFHVFHYRMPDVVSIASVTPFVPSPLTVKMAIIAALLQAGDVSSARGIAPQLPQIEVRIMPPPSAFSFKAFLRYRSAPAVGQSKLDDSGSFYPSRPHIREYALFSDVLTVFLGLPPNANVATVVKTLKNIRYLGCKDSLVTCLDVGEVDENEVCNAKAAGPLAVGNGKSLILGADFATSASPRLEDLLPGSRKKEHYQDPLPVFALPGRIITRGRTRIFWRDG